MRGSIAAMPGGGAKAMGRCQGQKGLDLGQEHFMSFLTQSSRVQFRSITYCQHSLKTVILPKLKNVLPLTVRQMG